MSILTLFEDMRRSNADFYTANPLITLEANNPAEFERLAKIAGMTTQELSEHARKAHPEMTCPLCGRPATHLVNCKGCGGDAFGLEWQEAYGPDFAARCRARLDQAVANLPHGDRAGKHAYLWGGCHICPECWLNTLPTSAYETCPLKLLTDLVLDKARLPFPLMMALRQCAPEERLKLIQNHFAGIKTHWAEIWNTVADPEQRQAVANWRRAIINDLT